MNSNLNIASLEKEQDKKTIRNLLVIGDSQSDRGLFFSGERIGTLFVLLLRTFYRSPKNRFTNGLNWVDHLAANFLNQFTINDLYNNESLRSDDIEDAIIAKDLRIRNKIGRFDFDDTKMISYQSEDFLRCYAEGGLTNHNYAYSLFSKAVTTRKIVPHLSDKIKQIKQDDKDRSLLQKKETLIIIWSGTNDIGLVNDSFDQFYKDKIYLSIKSLEENMDELIQSGYCHFLLFNTPDGTLSPRFKQFTKEELTSLKQTLDYFNAKLQKLVMRMRLYYPECTFNIFDINAKFINLFSNTDAYGLDNCKKNTCYVKSPDYKPVTIFGKPQPAPGYFFWDEVHPTTYVHHLIANMVDKNIRSLYDVQPPNYRAKKNESQRHTQIPSLKN